MLADNRFRHGADAGACVIVPELTADCPQWDSATLMERCDILFPSCGRCSAPDNHGAENAVTTEAGLWAATVALDALVERRAPDRTGLLAAVPALKKFCWGRKVSRTLRDAAACLESLAEGGAIELDTRRAARLANAARHQKKD